MPYSRQHTRDNDSLLLYQCLDSGQSEMRKINNVEVSQLPPVVVASDAVHRLLPRLRLIESNLTQQTQFGRLKRVGEKYDGLSASMRRSASTAAFRENIYLEHFSG